MVIEEDGRIVGAVEWAAVEPGRTPDDVSRFLGEMLEGFRVLKKVYGLRAVVIQTPCDEIMSHLDASDIQEGEQQIRRLVVSNALER